jgi:hypothetical protein
MGLAIMGLAMNRSVIGGFTAAGFVLVGGAAVAQQSWQGTERTGAAVTLVGDELKYNATTPATGVTAYQVWKRIK